MTRFRGSLSFVRLQKLTRCARHSTCPLLRFSPSIAPPARNRRFPTHSSMKREPRRLPLPRARITIGVTSGETTREDSKSGRAHRERAFLPSPRNLISSNVIPETRVSAARGGATICIRALESLDSDFPLEAARRRRRRGRGGVEGSKERAKSGVDALSVSPRRERERGERLVEVSSPWIVPAIIYFLSDRGDRLYGGCSVQAPGSGSLPGSAYVLPRARRPSLSRGTGTLKNIDNRANTGRKNVDVEGTRYPV